MDYLAMNRSHFNRRKVEEVLKLRTIVIVIPRLIRQGVVPTEIRFPQEGTIKEVYATCGRVGSTRTRIRVEKCSEEVYQSSPEPVWNNIFYTDLYLDANEKTSKTSYTTYSLNNEQFVSPNDHFRVNIISAGENVEDITVEIVVELDTDLDPGM